VKSLHVLRLRVWKNKVCDLQPDAQVQHILPKISSHNQSFFLTKPQPGVSFQTSISTVGCGIIVSFLQTKKRRRCFALSTLNDRNKSELKLHVSYEERESSLAEG